MYVTFFSGDNPMRKNRNELRYVPFNDVDPWWLISNLFHERDISFHEIYIFDLMKFRTQQNTLARDFLSLLGNEILLQVELF